MASQLIQKRRKKTTQQILGSDAFVAISAVENIHLSSESRHRLDRLRNSALSPDQRRAEVIRAYKSGKMDR